MLGELDSATAPDLEAALTQALAHARAGVVVDISKLAFIGAAGFHTLERGQQAAERRGHDFLVLADPWKLRIAQLVVTRGLNIELAPSSGSSTMWALAGSLQERLAA